jgi:hypothetical protein
VDLLQIWQKWGAKWQKGVYQWHRSARVMSILALDFQT